MRIHPLFKETELKEKTSGFRRALPAGTKVLASELDLRGPPWGGGWGFKRLWLLDPPPGWMVDLGGRAVVWFGGFSKKVGGRFESGKTASLGGGGFSSNALFWTRPSKRVGQRNPYTLPGPCPPDRHAPPRLRRRRPPRAGGADRGQRST